VKCQEPECLEPDPGSILFFERCERMYVVRSCVQLLFPILAWSRILLLLGGLSACGPGTPDPSPSVEPSAGLDGPSQAQPVSQNRRSSHNDPVTPSARPGSLDSALASSNKPPSKAHEEQVPLSERPVLPERIAQPLDSPDVGMRLQALDGWAQQGPTALLDLLAVALDDDDEMVTAQALQLMEQVEQDWEALEAAAENEEVRAEQ
jgi:hypothetical protein